ncbi:hypothetical protein ACFPT7_19610 [Acidicapsa dinghuensis]|uniref:Uncharacterized protein n=1 Tax=Acidicapsa dinghuensis TaxID=2218256 RepID=A0ABW1EKQ3_9BACT|nr:hypothetical protein [Acidicapsa dinghuensis]
MQPSDLTPDKFSKYPPEAKHVAVTHLNVLRQLPLSFVASLLREVIDYDYRFPAERTAIDRELADLDHLSAEKLDARFAGFAQLKLTGDLERLDWVDEPGRFTEELSAYLWRTHQLDAFRSAATEYGRQLDANLPVAPLPIPRVGIAVIGKDVPQYDGHLFKQLRQHGTLFEAVTPDNGLAQILEFASTRASNHPGNYLHWYIDGGSPEPPHTSLTSVSYQGITPLRDSLLRFMQSEITRPGMGPEELRTHMAQLTPSDLGFDDGGDPVMGRYRLKLFTEGSGTQIFSTTFVQWACRECLRRAQPLTLVARYAPRQRQRSMNELLSNNDSKIELDPVGSLIDGDMGAYYHWINQQRLPGAEQSSLVVWYEGHSQALAVTPTLPRGTTSGSKLDLKGLLTLATS